MLADADLVLVMSNEHLAYVRELDSTTNVYLLAGYGTESVGRPIADPFGGGLEDYRATADELEVELKGILDRIKAA
jgi:protein-tyrosine-phosphatase